MTNHFPCSRLIRQAGKLARVVVWFAGFAVAQQVGRHEGINLRDLLPRTDPLAVQDLRFDPTFARAALQYLRSQNPDLLDQLAKSPAATHLLNHTRNFDYDVPKGSTSALVSHLLQPPSKHAGEIQTCERSLAFFSGPMLDDPHWVADDLRYLPDDFRFHGSLFLTFGYDIGVAINNTASLNCAHPRFKDHPRELLYYAIHELHHVGFMTYQPPPKLSELKTCADLLRLVEYSTQLEGMAVVAAYQRRHDDHATSDDPDYVALEDAHKLQREESLYFDDFNYLKRRGTEPADAAAWAVIDRMSSGERLWYRVGARMAQQIEKARGRTVLLELVKKGPADFLQTYQSLATTAAN
jgi:hypothetical protein